MSNSSQSSWLAYSPLRANEWILVAAATHEDQA